MNGKLARIEKMEKLAEKQRLEALEATRKESQQEKTVACEEIPKKTKRNQEIEPAGKQEEDSSCQESPVLKKKKKSKKSKHNDTDL